MSAEKITRNILLDMLGITLVEMRTHSNSEYAKVMSDIFHNVPSRLIANISPNVIYEDMKRVAKRHGTEKYLDALMQHSLKKDFSKVDQPI